MARVRNGLLLLLVSTAGVVGTRGALAEVRLRDLRVSAEPGGPQVERFDPGIRTVYATFGYQEASNHRVGVSLVARGGLTVFEAAQRYTGTGTATVAIEGTTVVHELASGLEEAALAAQANADKAATQEHGVQEYLAAVQGDLLTVEAAVGLLTTVPLGDANGGRLQAIAAVNAEALRTVRRALGWPASDVDRKRAAAEELRLPLQEMVGHAGQLQRSVTRSTDLPIPETGLDPKAAYTLQVRVTDQQYLVLSTEFRVARRPIVLLPFLARGVALGR